MDGYYVGVDLGGSHLRMGLLEGSGKILGEIKRDICDMTDEHWFINSIIDMWVELINACRCNPPGIIAIGFGSPGPLDPVHGIIESPPNLPCMRSFNVVRFLENKFNVPAFLINDADAAVLGEAWVGSARGYKNVVMLTLGTGVGSGVICEGRLIRGSGRAVELGHTDTFIPGTMRTCSCGSSGHFEAYAGTLGLAKLYCEIFGASFDKMTPGEIFRVSYGMKTGAAAFDQRWLKLADVYASYVARGIINAACSFNPECIVLGGGIISDNHILFQMIERHFQRDMLGRNIGGEYLNKMAVLGKDLVILPAKFNNPGIIGAVKHAIDQMDTTKEKKRGR